MACDPAKESCDWFDSEGLGLNKGNVGITGLFADPAQYNDPRSREPSSGYTAVCRLRG